MRVLQETKIWGAASMPRTLKSRHLGALDEVTKHFCDRELPRGPGVLPSPWNLPDSWSSGEAG